MRKDEPAITTNNVWNKLGSCSARTGKNNMPNICTSFHFFISNKVSSFLAWIKKPRSNLEIENRALSGIG